MSFEVLCLHIQRFEIRRATNVGTTEGDVARDTELSVDVNGNVEMFERGCQERVRKDGVEVVCAERAVVSARMD